MSEIDEELPGKIGYTNDGMVFFINTAVDPMGQKIQATFTWDPDAAEQIAKHLVTAANKAREARENFKEGNK